MCWVVIHSTSGGPALHRAQDGSATARARPTGCHTAAARFPVLQASRSFQSRLCVTPERDRDRLPSADPAGWTLPGTCTSACQGSTASARAPTRHWHSRQPRGPHLSLGQGADVPANHQDRLGLPHRPASAHAQARDTSRSALWTGRRGAPQPPAMPDRLASAASVCEAVARASEAGRPTAPPTASVQSLRCRCRPVPSNPARPTSGTSLRSLPLPTCRRASSTRGGCPTGPSSGQS